MTTTKFLGITMGWTGAAIEVATEVGLRQAEVERDIDQVRDGELTQEILLARCLDGADDDRVQGWREYVDAVVEEAGRTMAVSIEQATDGDGSEELPSEGTAEDPTNIFPAVDMPAAREWARSATAGDYLVEYKDTGSTAEEDPGSRCGFHDQQLDEIRQILARRDLRLDADDRGLVAVANRA